MSVRELLFVAAGGALGSLARYASSLMLTSLLGDRFPWGTLVVNVLGCLLLGWLLHQNSPASTQAKLAIGTGFLGAFTTFSTFGVQTHQLWARSPLFAIANVASNVILGLLAAGLGLYLASRWAT